jgi:bacteriorhodopsin
MPFCICLVVCVMFFCVEQKRVNLMNMLPGLAASQYALVYNVLSFAIASMLASFVFFLAARQQVGMAYRPALLFSALVVGIAGYHYLRIFDSFESAYTMVDGAYAPSGKPFNDAYRYVDWFLTVPLLLVELVAVLHLSKAVGRSMLIKLIIAAVLMIGLGYPGETEYTNMTMRAVWGTLSSIPFVYILYVLWVQLGAQVKNESAEVQRLLRITRVVLLATWGVYPITFLLPILGIGMDTSFVAVQSGYAIADVAAKCGYGLLIFFIARAKSEADGSMPQAKSHA